MLVEAPKYEITVNCADLAGDEKKQLKRFLASQPTVQEVLWRRQDLVVVLSDPTKVASPTLIAGVINALFRASREPMQAQEECKPQQDDTVLVALHDDQGRTVKIVRRPKG